MSHPDVRGNIFCHHRKKRPEDSFLTRGGHLVAIVEAGILKGQKIVKVGMVLDKYGQ